jgi:hypothetical protein
MEVARMVCYDSKASLGQAIFGHAQLGDQRRTRRLVETFDAMRRHPGGTLPEKLSHPPELRAFYRLCDQGKVTHEAVIEAARQYTLTRIAACSGPVLILHDATELDYTSLRSLVGDLGQIGTGSRSGYVCQNVLAVEAETGEVLGLLDQVLHHRVKAPKKESITKLRERGSRESLLWLHGTRHLPADRQLIDVCDQGSDTFEFLEHEFRSGRRFVIRACKTRKVYPGHEPVGEQVYLQDCVQSMAECGRFTMRVQAQPGRKLRKQAEFVVRGGPVLVCRPHAKRGNHGDAPLPLYVVQVEEVSPPTGEKPVTWTLLTNEPVHTFDDAWRVTQWYERRWIIEELHKAKKTGCRIEDMQFTTLARLEPAIALLSVVAVTLLNLRDASRHAAAKQRPAEEIVAPEYVETLSNWRYHESRRLTIYEFFMALARLGGHQNRKSDHHPGWLVLWRGWTKLEAMLDGYLVAKRQRSGKT